MCSATLQICSRLALLATHRADPAGSGSHEEQCHRLCRADCCTKLLTMAALQGATACAGQHHRPPMVALLAAVAHVGHPPGPAGLDTGATKLLTVVALR